MAKLKLPRFCFRYRLNKPLLTGISNSESRQPGKAPNFSVNWTVGDAGLEVINAMTGDTKRILAASYLALTVTKKKSGIASYVLQFPLFLPKSFNCCQPGVRTWHAWCHLPLGAETGHLFKIEIQSSHHIGWDCLKHFYSIGKLHLSAIQPP